MRWRGCRLQEEKLGKGLLRGQVQLHMSGLRMALTDRRDQGDVPGSCPRVWRLGPGSASHRGPGTVPVQQPQQAAPPAPSAAGEGGSSSAPPGYAEFVTSAVRSAMEPFLQNMAQVVGKQTAQITQVYPREWINLQQLFLS